MTSSIRLGRILGVEIGINWSWLVIFALIAWTLAVGVFPSQNPGLSDAAYVGMAVVAAVVFFASLLAHELGHAVQARREGMEIDGITLWLFGGVARFKGLFPSAGAEFRIAIAGPIVSALVGVTFLLVAVFVTLPGAVDGVLFWLGYINLLLLAFNLLPALPLDGGRVFRSALWHYRGDFQWATRIAGNTGRGFGYLLIAAGVFLFIFQGIFTGAWLAFIGWFLLQAATAETRFALAREALAGVRVRDVMSPEPAVVPADYTLGRFVDEVAWTRRHTTYPVVENGEVLGLLTFRCVAEIPRDEWDRHTVRECMIPRADVPVFREEQPAIDAFTDIGAGETGRGIVLDGGRIVGMVAPSDIMRALETGSPRRRGPRDGPSAGPAGETRSQRQA